MAVTANHEESAPLLRHSCEVCGRVEDLTSEQGFEAGWDYPPRLGAFGVVAPRTCGSCAITDTLWWALVMEKKNLEELTEGQRATLTRIQSEPESILSEVVS